jgi:hypothetical protein
MALTDVSFVCGHATDVIRILLDEIVVEID